MSFRSITRQVKGIRFARKQLQDEDLTLKSPKASRKFKNGIGINHKKKLGDATYCAKLNKSKGLSKEGKPLARVAKKPRN